MTSVEKVAQSALTAVGSSAGRVLAGTWVNERYQELIGTIRFKHTRKLGSIDLQATVTAGLATFTQGSRSVIGDATAQAAWRDEHIGWFIRTGVVWYPVVGREGNSLLIATPFAEDTATNASYVLGKREYDLAPNVRTPELYSFPRQRLTFPPVAPEFLDTLVPDRPEVSGGPRYAAVVGAGLTGGKRVELYPLSTTNEVLYFIYREMPDDLRLSDPLPGFIDIAVLKTGVLIDVMRWEQAQAARSGKIDIAALWRNDARAQETMWQRAIQAAILADQGMDDQTFITRTSRSYPYSQDVRRDITNAYDQVWSR